MTVQSRIIKPEEAIYVPASWQHGVSHDPQPAGLIWRIDPESRSICAVKIMPITTEEESEETVSKSIRLKDADSLERVINKFREEYTDADVIALPQRTACVNSSEGLTTAMSEYEQLQKYARWLQNTTIDALLCKFSKYCHDALSAQSFLVYARAEVRMRMLAHNLPIVFPNFSEFLRDIQRKNVPRVLVRLSLYGALLKEDYKQAAYYRDELKK